MARLDRDGVAIHYEVHGQGPAILLSHGYSATCRMWDGQIAALRDRFQVIVWDMRGHGESDYPTDPAAYSEAATVEDMAAILRACSIQRAVIGGLSLGGYMSLAFHRAHPGDDARADDLRHRPRLPQRRGARGVEPARPPARRRPGRARPGGARHQRRGAHEPAPRCIGPGRRGARHADAARRLGDRHRWKRSRCRVWCWSAARTRTSSPPPTTWHARSRAPRRW